MGKNIIVFCTSPSPEISEKITNALVEAKLAACCNIIADVKSIYRWQNRIESGHEQLLLIKSTEENYKMIENCILSMHPYEVPEIITTEIVDGYEKYLKWMNESIKVDTSEKD